jgi:hypothetical protein
LTIADGAAVTIPTNTAVTVNNRFVNQGAVSQTRNVIGNGDITFLDLGPADYNYGGVTLNANDTGSGDLDLGDTTVTIYYVGPAGACAFGSPPTAHRCFIISPQNKMDRDATITFYFTEADLATYGVDYCNDLRAYHYIGNEEWMLAGNDGGMPDCNDAPALSSVLVTGVDSFSYFALGDVDPDFAPTAVTLQSLTAASALSLPFLLIAALFTGLAAAATAVVLRRRATA